MILFLVLPSTFRNSSFAELTPPRQKKNEFFVLLSTFRNFVRIRNLSLYKGSLGIEENQGYELATVLNSTFCYELHSKNP